MFSDSLSDYPSGADFSRYWFGSPQSDDDWWQAQTKFPFRAKTSNRERDPRTYVGGHYGEYICKKDGDGYKYGFGSEDQRDKFCKDTGAEAR